MHIIFLACASHYICEFNTEKFVYENKDAAEEAAKKWLFENVRHFLEDDTKNWLMEHVCYVSKDDIHNFNYEEALKKVFRLNSLNDLIRFIHDNSYAHIQIQEWSDDPI